ncbi:hypothetical protein D3C73_1594960 [compost metagenome]
MQRLPVFRRAVLQNRIHPALVIIAESRVLLLNFLLQLQALCAAQLNRFIHLACSHKLNDAVLIG